MRAYSKSDDQVFKYRTVVKSKDSSHWNLTVGPAAHEFWFVHEPTSPGKFLELADGKIFHVNEGETVTFISTEFSRNGALRSRPFSYFYSFSSASDLNLSVLQKGVSVFFPVRGTSRVMQSNKDGAVENYFGFKDWPKSHFSPEATNAVDIMAPQGTEIYSASSGTVVEVSQGNRDLGCSGDIYSSLSNKVIVLGDDGLQYEYAHIQKMSSFIKKGSRVAAGDRVALIGKSGGSSEAHLHFSIQTMLRNGRLISVPIRFLPCGKDYLGGLANNQVILCKSIELFTAH